MLFLPSGFNVGELSAAAPLSDGSLILKGLPGVASSMGLAAGQPSVLPCSIDGARLCLGT